MPRGVRKVPLVKPENPLRQDVLHITVSSNKHLSGLDKQEQLALVENFARKMESIWEDESEVIDCIRIIGTESADHLHAIDTFSVIENGSTHAGIHMHTVLSVWHSSYQIEIDLVALRKKLQSRFGYTPYLNVRRAKRGDIHKIIEYVSKTIHGRTFSVPKHILQQIESGVRFSCSTDVSDSFAINTQ
jgi:hypothetical protein